MMDRQAVPFCIKVSHKDMDTDIPADVLAEAQEDLDRQMAAFLNYHIGPGRARGAIG
jgi:hypothetical protein